MNNGKHIRASLKILRFWKVSSTVNFEKASDIRYSLHLKYLIVCYSFFQSSYDILRNGHFLSTLYAANTSQPYEHTFPSQLCFKLCAIDSIAAVMPEPVGYVSYKRRDLFFI